MIFPDLDAETREQMRIEVLRDIGENNLNLSKRFKPGAEMDYPQILLDAVDHGNPETFANSLSRANLFNSHELRNTKNGPIEAKVPVTAPQTFAEGEFNRFYMRGLCSRAIAADINQLTIYRAKEVSSPRPESQAMIDTTVQASALLEDLRIHTDVDTALHLPPGPNSGISVRLPTP
jgi:hypothetical protein